MSIFKKLFSGPSAPVCDHVATFEKLHTNTMPDPQTGESRPCLTLWACISNMPKDREMFRVNSTSRFELEERMFHDLRSMGIGFDQRKLEKMCDLAPINWEELPVGTTWRL